MELKTASAMVVAAARFEGTAAQAGEAFLRVAEWLKQRELPAHPWIGVYEDASDPDTYVEPDTGRMRGEVWIPFHGEARGDGLVEVRRIEPERVAFTVHEGDPSTVGATVRALKEWCRRQGLRPAGRHRQIYLHVAPGAAWRTEVQIPIGP
ncbi:MAG TPA: GyrI-like domain-containing protein [Candidatus Polarisedimenticolia bacterium]|nr:GyrI-like domain-containing protein [Candidatus Polarisedimenticolia bacterium]